MARQAILFDLDGTLVDSAPDIMTALNQVMKHHDLAAFSIEDTRSMIGHGVAALVEKALVRRNQPLPNGGMEKAIAEMIALYSASMTDKTVLMPHARETLQHLKSIGHACAVVSNKPQRMCVEILSHLGLDASLDLICGSSSALPRKPAPDMLHHAAAQLNLAVAFMVGDSATDVECARAAGYKCVIIRGGYTTIPPEQLNADYVLDSLAELPLLTAQLAA